MPSTATQLVVIGQPPASVTAGSPFATTVAVEDAQGNFVTGYSGSVAIGLANNPGAGSLAGTTSVNSRADWPRSRTCRSAPPAVDIPCKPLRPGCRRLRHRQLQRGLQRFRHATGPHRPALGERDGRQQFRLDRGG